MKLRSRGRNPSKRCVNIYDTSLESQEAQTAAADPLIQDIFRCLLKVESIRSTFHGQAHDSSGTEGSRTNLPDLLSRVAKLEEIANSATCVADTSHTPTSFPIDETTSFESLLNVSVGDEEWPADEEVLPDATEMPLNPATCSYQWRSRQKKKKRRRCPQIAFESAESEINGLSDVCVPPSGARAKSQEALTPMLNLNSEPLWCMAFQPQTTLLPQLEWNTIFLNSDCISARFWPRMSPCPFARSIVLVLWILTAPAVLAH